MGGRQGAMAMNTRDYCVQEFAAAKTGPFITGTARQFNATWKAAEMEARAILAACGLGDLVAIATDLAMERKSRDQ